MMDRRNVIKTSVAVGALATFAGTARCSLGVTA